MVKGGLRKIAISIFMMLEIRDRNAFIMMKPGYRVRELVLILEDSTPVAIIVGSVTPQIVRIIMLMKKPKTIQLIIKDPRNSKGEFRFDCTEVTIENEFEDSPVISPSLFRANRPTGSGTITARFVKKRGKK